MKKMKYIFVCLLVASCMTGCKSKKAIEEKPEITQIRAICDLATLETYYHNVAKIKKEGALLQKDRILWIEYTGIARIGIDLSEVDMKIEGVTVKVDLPKAKLLSVNVSQIDKDSYYYSEDNKLFFKNEFTAEDETKAINEAQNNMKNDVENNIQLLNRAQDRAKDLIEKYIKELGNLSGLNYKIEWNFK